jgi:acetylornithine deacetylase/succinyl-diaminopimelate desuccinylase-like protein
LLGDGILVLTDLTTSPSSGTSVLPDRCVATFDRRLLSGETEGQVLEEISRLISLARDIDPDINADVRISEDYVECFTGKRIRVKHFAPGWFFEESEELVEKALRGLRLVGMDPSLSESGFGTNGCYYGGIKGIPTISFGPSEEKLAHTKDERLDVDQLVKATRGYMSIAASFLEG